MPGAHRGDGKRFVVRADEKLTAFLELGNCGVSWRKQSDSTMLSGRPRFRASYKRFATISPARSDSGEGTARFLPTPNEHVLP